MSGGIITDFIDRRKEQEDWLRDNIQFAVWTEPGDFPGLHNFEIGDVLLAWIQKRTHYCDRGHWQGQLEFSPGNPLDSADGGIHYYMRLSVAKQELQEKLMWRVCKQRVIE